MNLAPRSPTGRRNPPTRSWLLVRGRGAASLLGALTLTLLLTACSSSGANSSGASTTGVAIKIGTTTAPDNLDPATAHNGGDFPYDYFVFDALLKINPKSGALEPDLATSWNWVGAGKLQLDVTLRKSVLFQDGTPLNAQAVVAWTDYYLKQGDNNGLLYRVTNITAIGPYEVAYHLSQPNAQLPDALAYYAGMAGSPRSRVSAWDCS